MLGTRSVSGRLPGLSTSGIRSSSEIPGSPRLDQAAAFCDLADFDSSKAKAFRERSDGGTRILMVAPSPFPGKMSRPEKNISIRMLYCTDTALGRPEGGKVEDISCRTSKVAGFSVAFCWTARPPTGRHNVRMLISMAGRKCSSRYSRYGVSTSSIHFMNARTRRDRLLRCATTRDTASARRRNSGMISTSAPLFKYRPIPNSGA